MNTCKHSLLLALTLVAGWSIMALAQRMPQDSWYLAHEFRGDIEGGKFYNPLDAALGPDGNVYITDYNNHQVQVLTTNGVFLRKWGGYGGQAGQLNLPVGIHVDRSNLVYVCDHNNHRVQVFDASGRVVRVIGQYGTNPGQFNQPRGVTVDDDGNIYVGEDAGARVSVFRPDGTFLRQWGSSGSGPGQFQRLFALCRTPNNRIAVLEVNGSRRIQVFEPDGTLVFTFNHHSANGVPYGIEADEAGNFYIAGRDWHGVSVYDPAGTYLRVFGKNGGGAANGQFNPYNLAVGGGRVYACDWNNHRLAVFTTGGAWVLNSGSYGMREFQDTHGIAVAADGSIFISDYQKHEIRKFDPDYNFIKRFGTKGTGSGQFDGPLEMAISPDQRLYVVEHLANRIHILDLEGNALGRFGSIGSGDGNFNRPWGIAVSSNRVYVADRDNQRIQVFDLDGNFLFKFGQLGSFDGYFNQPHGLAISPDGLVAVADYHNRRIQMFDADGTFVKKINCRHDDHYNAYPYQVCFGSDGIMYSQDNVCHDGRWMEYLYLRAYSADGVLLKQWSKGRGFSEWGTGNSYVSSLAETKFGDLIAEWNKVMRLWKRTYRTVHPPQGNALPLPAILAQNHRQLTGYVDIDYRVKDDDNTTVETAVLAFRNGGNTLGDIIPMRSFAEGTESNIGSNIIVGQSHRITWDVQQDWNTDFGEVQFEILARDSRDLLNLDFIQIPATGTNEALKISRTPVNNTDFLSVWYWLVATDDPDITLTNGRLFSLQQAELANGTSTTTSGREYLFNRLGYREATAAEILRAREGGTPGVINQWTPKLRVGPDERPVAVNAYGFDTGGTGFWVVPLEDQGD